MGIKKLVAAWNDVRLKNFSLLGMIIAFANVGFQINKNPILMAKTSGEAKKLLGRFFIDHWEGFGIELLEGCSHASPFFRRNSCTLIWCVIYRVALRTERNRY